MDASVLVAEIARRWPGAACDVTRIDPGALTGLDGEHRDDLVLAAACVAAVDSAIAELEARVIEPVLASVRTRFGDDLEEIAQQARVRLLVGESPAIAHYRGRGSLAAYIRTIVTRLAIDRQRAAGPATDPIDSLVDHAALDPELVHMRDRYATDLRDALQVAWRSLAAHERFVLDLELHRRLGIEQIAGIYGIHRTNAARRLGSARAAFVAAVRAALRAKLAVGDATLDSVLRLMTTSTKWAALEDLAHVER